MTERHSFFEVASFALRHPIAFIEAWLKFAARWWLWMKIMRGLHKLIEEQSDNDV